MFFFNTQFFLVLIKRLHFVRGLSEFCSPYFCPAKLIKYVHYIPNSLFPSPRLFVDEFW